MRVPSQAINGNAKVTVRLPEFKLIEFADPTLEIKVQD